MRRCLPIACLTLLWAGCEMPPRAATVEGSVRDAYTGAPIAGASVELDGVRATTDLEGRFELSALEGTRRLELRAPGYADGARAGVIVAPEAPPVEAVLFPIDAPDEVVSRHLAEVAPIAPREIDLRGPDFEGDIGGARWADHDLPVPMPDRIRVWRSQGTALVPTRANGWADRSCDPSAVVDDLFFEEYVKGVIPHEWSPSWHRESLMAGAIAARSYALSHHLRGGRWDCADVDDGTVTQVYRDDRAVPTDEAVEATRGQIIIRAGDVVFAEYSAENADPTAYGVDDPTCAGEAQNGHGRGMCQWGTQRWANGTCATPPCDLGALGAGPKDHVWMVEHYYPGATVAGGAHIGEPCGVLPPQGGTIDDADLCAFRYGPIAYWHQEAGGFADRLFWTNAFVSATPSNWGRFEMHFAEPGRYRLETYVAPGFGGHAAVRYEVDHAAGLAAIEIDQRAGDGWVLVGEHDFSELGEARILDTADALDTDRRIAFDAIRVTRLDGPPGDAGAPPVDGGEPTDGGSGSPDAGPGSPDAGGGGGEMGCGCTVGSRRAASSGSLALLGAGLLLRCRRRRRMS